MTDTFGNIQATANALVNILGGGNNIPTNLTSTPKPSDSLYKLYGLCTTKNTFYFFKL